MLWDAEKEEKRFKLHIAASWFSVSGNCVWTNNDQVVKTTLCKYTFGKDGLLMSPPPFFLLTANYYVKPPYAGISH
jgi:hypothetical protein